MKTTGLLSIDRNKSQKPKSPFFFQDTAGRFSEFRENFKLGVDISSPPYRYREKKIF